MGAVSRSGLKRVFIGNTAERVLDDLPCDVLVVKPARSVSRVAARVRGVRVVPTQPLAAGAVLNGPQSDTSGGVPEHEHP